MGIIYSFSVTVCQSNLSAYLKKKNSIIQIESRDEKKNIE